MLNLYDYISSYDFLNDLSTDQQYLIYSDITPFPSKIPWYITLVSREEIWTSHISQDIITIGITSQLTSQDIKILKTYLPDSCSWINCNPGVLSTITKNNPESDDIVFFLQEQYTVYEPFSREHLIELLWTQSYIRVFDQALADKFQLLQRNHGIAHVSGDHDQSYFTVFSSISCCDATAGAISLVSKGSENIFELYVWTQLPLTLQNKWCIESIQRTKHCIIILDHKATESIIMIYEQLIKQSCGHDIHIQFILPQYHLISSILPEYIHEEAWFDQPALESYLQNTIDHYNHQESFT